MAAFVTAGLATAIAKDEKISDRLRAEAKPLLEKLNLSDAREKTLLAKLAKLHGDANDWSWPEKLRKQLAAGDVWRTFMQSHGFRADELAWRDKLDLTGNADLATSVALFYTRMLLQEGPAEFEQVWPKWNEGDTPGSEPEEEKRDSPAMRELAQNAADLSALLKKLAPANIVYSTLQPKYAEMSQRIDELQKQFIRIPDIDEGKVVNVGDSYGGIEELKRRLREEGFLPPDAAREEGNTYTQEISDAVKRFQEHHGRKSDGILGPNTLAELNRTPKEKLQMLRINLHRARKLPDDPGERYVIVNIPSNRVFVFAGEGKPVLTMKVIVGKSVEERQTPVFRDVMQVLEFGPYWNVPISIARNEIVPKARSDGGYLASNNYEIVTAFEGGTTVPVSSSALSRVESGELFIRQKPGEQNALGRVKFLFPNDYAIYLHDTPKDQLFDEAERDFSHGCIRVEKPADLAEWVLKPQGWERSKVEQKLANAQGEQVQVEQPVNVYIVYFTAFPTWDADDERPVRFYQDIYDRDKKLL